MVDEYLDTLVVIRYHSSGSDPFYKPDAASRMSYYGAGGYPYCYFDGIVQIIGGGSGTYNQYRNVINSRKVISSPLEINPSGTYSSISDSGTIDVQIIATAPITHTNLRIRYALVESGLPYGGEVYEQVLRDMFPSPTGVALTISEGDTVYDSQDFRVDPGWDFLNCEVVVFVQSDNGREVLQATRWPIPADFPGLYYVGNTVYDSLGNNDGRTDPGETVEMVVTLGNEPRFKDATNITAVLSSADPYVTVVPDTVSFPDIAAGSTGANTAEPFAFSVDVASPVHRADFSLDISAQPNNYTATLDFWIMIGRPGILVVDDDAGNDYETCFTNPLDNLGELYDVWDRENQGALGSELPIYEIAIWFTGDDATTTLLPEDITDLTTFLDGGGRLFITGQNIGEDITGDPFYSDYLHASYVANSVDHMLDGVSGNPIGDGLRLATAGGDPSNQTSQDVIEPLGGALPVFTYSADSIAAIHYHSGTYAIVYFGFGFEAINRTGPFAGKDTVMARILQWLWWTGTEETPHGDLWHPSLRLDCLPNPFLGEASLDYSVEADGKVTLKVYNVAGELVRTLVDAFQPAGHHAAAWDGKTGTGERLPGGVYFCRLTSGRAAVDRKVVLLR